MGYNHNPGFTGHSIISDQPIGTSSHGGFAWYIKNSLYSPVFGITYKSSFISFGLDMVPYIAYIVLGVYKT